MIKNSIEAIKDTVNPELRVKLENSEHEVLLTIEDNGPGIPDEILENIFVPFYSTKEGGSGIGLSLSRQIMRLHKSQLSVETSSQGTAFQLHFPLTSELSPEE